MRILLVLRMAALWSESFYSLLQAGMHNQERAKRMIIGFVGKMGSGKTLCMTMLAHWYYTKGSEIFANYSLKFPYKSIDYNKIKGLDIEFQNSVLLLDEIHTFIDSRASMTNRNKAVSYFITQSRKRQLIFMYTTQRWGQVDVRMRNNTDYVFKCRKTESENKKNVYINIEMYNYDGKMRRLKIRANPYFNLYDTTQIVNPFEDVD